MKNFHIRINYNGHFASFDVKSKDTLEDVEKSILDKLGKNEVKFESDGFSCKSVGWITYEEVINESRPLHYEVGLGVRMATRASEGREA